MGDALAAGAGGTRDQVEQAAASAALDPRGLTGVGGGILLGVGELPGAAADTLAVVVVTDGVENVPPMIADVAGSITTTTYAIGIGGPADINANALQAICQGHAGYLLVTGDLAAEERFRLHKYFLQVHAGVTNQQIVVDPAGELTLGAVHRIPFQLSRADVGADAIVVCPVPELLDVQLEAPDGTVVDAGAGIAAVQELTGDWLAGLRLSLPVLPGNDHAGLWTAMLSIDRKRLRKLKDRDVQDDTLRSRSALAYSFVVIAHSDLEFDVEVRVRGTRAALVALLDAYGIPFWGDAAISAQVTSPSGRTRTVRMRPRGAGRYSLALAVPDAGLYTVRVIATGELDGQRFARERVLSIATMSGEPSEGANEPDLKPRGPRLRKPRRKLPLGSSLAQARPPELRPEPEPIDPHAQAHHRHGMGGEHFPAAEDLPEPVAWELGGRPKRTPKRKPKRPSGRGGHEH
jgi:hypothetical protein